MSQDRFQLISCLFHLADDGGLQIYSSSRKLLKINNFWKEMNKKFQVAYMPDRNIDINESLTLCKGQLGFLYLYYTYNKPTFKYLTTKTANLGIKTYEHCGSSTGYLRKFIIYRGSVTDGHWNVDCLDNLKN